MARASEAGERRYQDTRRKIELGGLIVKVGMRDEDKAFLLGLLYEGQNAARDPETRARMVERGRKEFSR